ncbi:MAG: bifunctional heptose 7-phosphate kinase/heptose 1-phosphate adenyltransferase, partial [Alphaproteobacteria bacterium]|nr:bifunctional heptose 7-phosphate kinase/heptose 1-phosphate adenyltransferase [Alphaproteobacteria bacterium]
HYLSAPVRDVSAVTGAGDSLCAVFSAGLAAGYAPTEALELAAAAAAAAIGKVGPATFTMHELLQQIAPSVTQSAEVHTLPALQMQTQLWRETGEKIGFINGCFDLLHPGHVALLQFCTQHCDRLIVAVNSDASVRRLKGCSRPINDAETRCAMLQALPQVATVTVFEDDTPLALLEALRPDCLIKGGDYQPDQVVGAELLASYGGRVFIAPFKHGYATTRTINRINGTG